MRTNAVFLVISSVILTICAFSAGASYTTILTTTATNHHWNQSSSWTNGQACAQWLNVFHVFRSIPTPAGNVLVSTHGASLTVDVTATTANLA